MRIVKERAREIHDGFVGKGSGPKREANIAAAARPSVRPWGIHSCHGFFWLEAPEDLSNERESAHGAATFLIAFQKQYYSGPPVRSIAKTIRNGSRDFSFSFLPSSPSFPTYLSIARRQGGTERGREPKSAGWVWIWMLQRQPFLAAVAVTLRASS